MERQEEALREFGRRLTWLREKQELSIAELAVRCGLDTLKIIQIEAGQVDFPVTVILALARGLGVPPDELLETL